MSTRDADEWAAELLDDTPALVWSDGVTGRPDAVVVLALREMDPDGASLALDVGCAHVYGPILSSGDVRDEVVTQAAEHVIGAAGGVVLWPDEAEG